MDQNDFGQISETSPLFARLGVNTYRTIERKVATVLLLLTNVLERIAFFSVTSSLVYFLTKAPLCWTEAQATTASLIFNGAAYFLGVAGGFLADAGTSKFSATVLGFVIYVIGFVSLPIHGRIATALNVTATHEDNSSTGHCRAEWTNGSLPSWCGDQDQPCSTTLYITFVVIGAGAAVVHTTIAVFGADQVRQHGLAVTRGFFSWLYWTRNVGALIANSGIAYLQLDTTAGGFFTANLVSLFCLVLSAIIFVSGWRFYVRRPANRQAILNFFAITREGGQVKKQAAASGQLQPNLVTLDYAKVRNGGNFHETAVEEVKAAGRIVLVFTLLIFYWIGFAQLTNSFQVQGLHLRLPGSGLTAIPPPALVLFDNVSVILTVPFLDNIVYPYLGRRGYKLTLHVRMSVGMFFAALSFGVAGLVEHFRLESLETGAFPQQVGFTIYNASPLTVFVQIPQYVLLGISEAFTIVTGMEFTYLLAPRAMQSVMMGVFFAFAGVGTFVSSSLPNIQQLWFGSSNINASRMDWIYYTLAGVQLAAGALFIVIGRRYDLGLDRLTIKTELPPHADRPRWSLQEQIDVADSAALKSAAAGQPIC